MPEVPSLNMIARGEATPSEARAALVAVFDDPTPELMEDVYLGLRAWVWKALDWRRRDPDLRDWADILDAVSALLAQNGQAALAQRMTVLHELLGESVTVAETMGAAQIARQRHVAEVMDYLAAHDGSATRAAINGHLPLGRANLTRVLNTMSAAGLVVSGMQGREPVVQLARG